MQRSNLHGKIRRRVEDQGSNEDKGNGVNVQAKVVGENWILQTVNHREVQVDHKEGEYENSHCLKSVSS